jgi:flagellar protein FliS
MRASLKALESYGAVKIESVVNDANGVQLIQMLFDGLLESLSVAKGHLMHKDKIEKSKALTRAGRIVVGLQGALDLERGGELARNLFELYSYVTRRVLHANLHNDVEAIDEVYGLMSEIRSAWQTMPALVPPNRADQTRGAIN